MCFYCILKGLFCVGEGTKTWGHGREQAILGGQFSGTCIDMLVFSEKRSRLTCWFFSHFFCWTMGILLEYRNLKTNILPLSLLQSCKYDDFCSLFNVAKKQRCDTLGSADIVHYTLLHYGSFPFTSVVGSESRLS